MKRVAIALMASVLCAASAQAVVLNSWENSTEGWSYPANPGTALSTFSTTIGVTDGSTSVLIPIPAGWNGFVQSDWSGSRCLPISENHIISVDVTPVIPIPATANIDIGFYIQGGCNTAGASWEVGSAFAGGMALNKSGTTRVTLDYATVAGFDFAKLAAPDANWTGLRLWAYTTGTNDLGASYVPGQFYFDNLQVTGAVPEPTSLGLLGLGSLALLRRRRA